MPRVRKIAGGKYYHRETGRLAIGDTADVGEKLAAYLVEERNDFERAQEDDVEELPEPDGLTVDEDETDDDGENFEINGWLENDYQDRADAVLEGGLDDYLEEIEEAETSDTVIDAVEERRAELEEA